MFIAATTGTFLDLPFEQACTRIADCEFDSIELTLNDGDHFNAREVAANPEAALIRCRDATRLSITALDIQCQLTQPEFLGIFNFAKQLKVTQVTIPSLELGTPFNDETDRMKYLVSLATQDSIRLSLRTTNGHLTEDPHTAVELCKTVKGLGLSLDPSHYMTGPYREQSHDIVYEFTTHVYLRDSTESQLQVPVGLGEIDYSRIIAQLKRFDYRRAFAVDIMPDGLDHDARGLELRKLRMLLESLL